VKFAELVARAENLAGGRRQLLGICGPPGAGKSTLSARLVDALGDRAVLVAMDGFHLAQRELGRLGRTGRKGAPDTFDAAGYVELLARLRRNGPDVQDAETVYAPEFRREIEEPVACAVPVPPSVPLVVTEGNYLLLPDSPWCRIRTLVEEIWFLAPPERARQDWLIARHEWYGRSREQAAERTLGSDQANADLVVPTQARADLVLREVE
jgi:pantothenate kinase